MVRQKTKEEFVVWIRMALNDRESGAYEELYQFLCSCFMRADLGKKGKIDLTQFDALVEEAAELPRKYGYAPTIAEMYKNDGQRLSARQKVFNEIDKKKTGYVTLNQWIVFAIDHIISKLVKLPKDYLVGSSEEVNKAEFITFIKKAVDRKTPEFRQLYYFLMRTFQAGDKDGYGYVLPTEFDEMIECAARAPRRFGLAPNAEDIFKNDMERIATRMQHFSVMNYHSTGKISFDEWLQFAMDHIIGKVASL